MTKTEMLDEAIEKLLKDAQIYSNMPIIKQDEVSFHRTTETLLTSIAYSLASIADHIEERDKEPEKELEADKEWPIANWYE